MERFRDLHEELSESEKNKKRDLFARKELKSEEQQGSNNPTAQTEQMQHNEQEARTKKSPSPTKAPAQKSNLKSPIPPRPKSGKKRKHPILRGIVIFLIVLSLYSLSAFTLGNLVAANDSSIPSETEETFNGFTSADGAHNILLLGSDSREGENARADTVMVLQLDGPSHRPKLISFMRDTYVDIPDVGYNKLNAAYAYGGAELVRQTLADNFGIDCQYYAKVDFQSFEKVIDTLFPRGVKIDAEKDMSENLEVPITKGEQRMDGLTLLQYARFRMDEEGDFGRVRRQQQVMDAVFKQMRNPLALMKLPYAAGKVMGYASTDLPSSFILRNSLSLLKGTTGVDRLSVPVTDSWSYGNTDVGSVLMVDTDLNQQAIEDFLAK